MTKRRKAIHADSQRLSTFGLVFVPNANGDPRTLTRGLITQALHRAAQEAAAQAERAGDSGDGDDHGCA